MIKWLMRLFQRESTPTVIVERMPPGDGWKHWCYLPPPFCAAVIEVWRAEWGMPTTIDRREASPLMNIHGLYWRWPEARLVEH